MPLAPQTHIGPYEILAPLGAGGMGEVWRARDHRLGREVAIKVMLTGFAEDADRLRRFEQEAKAVALLNHPHVMQIYDTGLHEGSPYLVMELLDGQTLRERLAGKALSPRKALELAAQIAQGLAAAHEKGITHRDLKPENVFITAGERVKILDFGLAKFRQQGPAEGDDTQEHATQPMETRVGVVVGTVGYMSPEQVNGRPADPRSDIFSFGVILWEMLAGRRPFVADSAIETMHAILKEDPPELVSAQGLPPSVRRMLHRCLEKDPRARYQSAQDLAFELEGLVQELQGSAATSMRLPRLPSLRRIPRSLLVAAGAALILLGGGLWAGRALARREPPVFHRLTYRNGIVRAARFAPDGQTYVFHLAKGGEPGDLYLGRLDGLGARPLGLPKGAELLSISQAGSMALLLPGPGRARTLAQADLGGGAPREMLEGVRGADWGPGGKELAVVRDAPNGRQRLEYPVGTVLFEAPDAIGIENVRVSPQGDQIAFTEATGAGTGRLSVVDRSGRRKVLLQAECTTLLWSGEGDELLVTVRPQADRQEVRAISMGGRQRLVYAPLGRLALQDRARDGRVLAVHTQSRLHMALAEEQGEREISWLQYSIVADLAAGGSGVLFSEMREGSGPGGTYFQRLDEPEPIRLGDGDPLALSPDGKWAVVRSMDERQILRMLPVGPGEPRDLPSHGIKAEWVVFLDGGRRLLLGGVDEARDFRYFVQDLASGEIRPWIPELGVEEAYCLVAPDGQRVALGPVEGGIELRDAAGRKLRHVPGMEPGEALLQWSADGGSVFIGELRRMPARVWRLDLATGRRSPVRTFAPVDALGVDLVHNICVTPDGKRFVYSFKRILSSDLYLMEGWR